MATPEDTFRKAFALMGSPVAGEREAALHCVYGLLEKRSSPPRSFSDLLDALENNVPKPAYEEMADRLRQSEKRADTLDGERTRLTREVAGLKALVWMQSHWKHWVGAALMLAAVAGVRVWHDRLTGAAGRAAVEASLRGDLAGDRWGLGYSRPFIETADGEPYWVILWGGIDRDHTDGEGRPVTLHCLHLYATPAVAESRVYRKPEPFGFFGRLRWSERAVLCRLAPDQEATP